MGAPRLYVLTGRRFIVRWSEGSTRESPSVRAADLRELQAHQAWGRAPRHLHESQAQAASRL